MRIKELLIKVKVGVLKLRSGRIDKSSGTTSQLEDVYKKRFKQIAEDLKRWKSSDSQFVKSLIPVFKSDRMRLWIKHLVIMMFKDTERSCFRRCGRKEKGVAAIEYGLIAALIALAIIVALSSTGAILSTLFNTVATCL